jgi:cytochrome c peroxidase
MARERRFESHVGSLTTDCGIRRQDEVRRSEEGCRSRDVARQISHVPAIAGRPPRRTTKDTAGLRIDAAVRGWKGGTMRKIKRVAATALAVGTIASMPGVLDVSANGTLTPQEQLGKAIFFDTNLSTPAGQACATCHGPSVGWTGPSATINAGGAVYEGAVPGRFGNRKPPASAYAGDSPVLHFDGGVWVGGMFWDGRATGLTLGDPLAEQALGPFLNPAEQNNASPQAVIDKVLASDYTTLFEQVCTDTDTSARYQCIGRAIAAYERSTEVNPFTSKYDYWLKGQAKFTGQELRGWQLFNGKGKCAACHVAPLFTDFSYDNVGMPRNPMNPFYDMPFNPDGESWVDPGLGGFLKAAGYPESVWSPAWGQQKVPTLRNVDLRPGKKFVKAYGHNGYFKSLEEIVHFYNTRDVPGAGWPVPEVAANVNTTELGNLGLNHGEELAIVEFMKTLSDGYVPK